MIKTFVKIVRSNSLRLETSHQKFFNSEMVCRGEYECGITLGFTSIDIEYNSS